MTKQAVKLVDDDNNRPVLIREFVNDMKFYLNKRNQANVQIRDLHRQIRKVLGFQRHDFITAMRILDLAGPHREATLNVLGEILKAAGVQERITLAKSVNE